MIILCLVGIMNYFKVCYKPLVIYRYLPRSSKEDSEEPIPIKDIFENMFYEPSIQEGGYPLGSINKIVENSIITSNPSNQNF